jgi:predicted nicotinamide N-methyase
MAAAAVMHELTFDTTYTRSILRACARGERAYCHTADTSARAPARCTYVLAPAVTVTVQELQVSSGGLGWRVWVGALALAEWMVAHAEAFAGASVLELGAGLGLAGLTAAQLGAREVVLSDCLAPLVANLAAAVELNASRTRAETVVRAAAVRVPSAAAASASHATMEAFVDAAHRFDATAAWLAPCAVFDVVIGSEILYERYHAQTMALEVARHLRRPAGPGPCVDGAEAQAQEQGGSARGEAAADDADGDATAGRGADGRRTEPPSAFSASPLPPPRAYVLYVNRDDRFLCADGILWAFIRAANGAGLVVRVAAAAVGGLRAEFAPVATAAEAERARAAAVHHTDAADDAQVALLTLRWFE